MKIDFTAEQAKIVACFMKMQAEHGRRQAAETLAQAEAAASLAQKVSDGAIELNEAEVRTLQTFLGGLDVIAGIAPGILRDDAVPHLKELTPRIEAAKRKFDN